MEWEDATSYSRGQRGKVPQTAWEAEIDGARIWVSCGHLYFPGRWVMNCRVVGIVEKDLGSTEATSEQARDRAVQEVWAAARAKAACLTGLADTAFAVPPLAE